ncbi:class I SAM-dependent methyltransferase [Paucibacter sp. DJ1R-11]|uniref:class I SAM-dependent methyltransferase n=1 Tax=Paucibacter sp. DJ1R-11 TaxID=2893556 RepID=UPI0021E42FC2|nr:class I SAM-dependent methyltransferase [Paucibacter sp. DJ1R-11]MCV2364691.1 class I SAM-dependent methyltransferase [Paucibacter sp. DJ1R-11]
MSRSFRDPDGFVQDEGGQIRRHVHARAVAATLEFLASPLYEQLTSTGDLIAAGTPRQLPDGSLELSHERIPVPSYAFEWTPAMLADAAQLTLRIQQQAWSAGWTLKDAAASNVLFEHGQPRFCDLLSFRKRQPGDDQGWPAYGQFIRNFILPLLVVRQLGRTPRDIFLASRDGLRAAETAPFLPWHAIFGLSMLLHVWLPAWLERRRIRKPQSLAAHAGQIAHAKPDTTAPAAASTSNRSRDDAALWMLRDLQRLVTRLARPATQQTSWSHYTHNREHYGNRELDSKHRAVQSVLASGRYRHVLDIGANSGEFSRMALEAGASVLALDDDLGALDHLHRQASQEKLAIQCLHANFARPSPATGWCNSETLSLSQRLASRFDLVLMLAVIHHLVVTERLPLSQVFEQVAALCTDCLLIEFVPVNDPRFVEIAGTNLDLYQDWNLHNFLMAAQTWFELRQTYSLDGGSERQLLLLGRRS